jgi:hypothetical protein
MIKHRRKKSWHRCQIISLKKEKFDSQNQSAKLKKFYNSLYYAQYKRVSIISGTGAAICTAVAGARCYGR